MFHSRKHLRPKCIDESAERRAQGGRTTTTLRDALVRRPRTQRPLPVEDARCVERDGSAPHSRARVRDTRRPADAPQHDAAVDENSLARAEKKGGRCAWTSLH